MDTTIDTLQKKIDEARAGLPEESRRAIDAVNWRLIILGLKEENKYTEGQLDMLETETELLLCGLLLPEDYVKELQNQMKINEIEALALANKMNEIVFKKIQAELEKELQVSGIKNAPANIPPVITPTVSNNPVRPSEAGGQTPKIIPTEERFLKLPKDIQDAIAKSDYQKTLYTISQKYKLTIEQMGQLDEITAGVMSGTINPDKYGNELASALKLAPDKNNELVNDVNEGVLKNIRELLKQRWGEEKVPVPPYAVPPVNLPTASSEKIGGVEIIEEKPLAGTFQGEESKITMKEDALLAKSGVNIMEEKLRGSTANQVTVSDHSLAKPATTTADQPPNFSHDPYRENV